MSCSEQDLEEFRTEAIELLDVAEKALLSLGPHSDFRIAFDSIFRCFHNLKGAAGMMELLVLQAHTHELESILMQFKETGGIPQSHVDLFLRGIDAARAILEGKHVEFDYGASCAAPVVKSSPQPEAMPAGEISTSAIDEFISECGEIIESVSRQLRAVEQKAFDRETLNTIYRDTHSLKGGAYLFGYISLGEVAHAMESAMEPVRDGTHQPDHRLLNGLFKALEFAEQELELIRHKSPGQNRQKAAKLIAQELVDATSGLSVTSSEVISPPPSTPARSPDNPAAREKEQESGASIRVPVTLLDTLMTLMGEMVLVRNQVLQFSSRTEDLEFMNLSKRLNGVTSEIQGTMMKTRMQPIGNVTSKFHRIARDLSQELKKNITLSVHGAETELDKSLLEAIKDPLTHIVRNSCDHGIETPEVRKRSGKPEVGTISIRSYHEGGQVVIEVSDDGKGLHRDVLIKKALEKGLISQSQVHNLSEKDIFGLIFAPGFSTAAAVTNVSGRGVGMDVVRTNIEKIGGTVELNSVAGKGTVTKLKIPLTLAIIPALTIRSGSGIFAIPQVKLEELVRVDPANPETKIEYLHGTPMYRLRGNILPLVDLNRILKLEPDPVLTTSVKNIAVLNSEQCLFGLIVDDIQDTADIVVKPLNRALKSLQIYSGATILGDGSISLILDVSGISKVAQIGGDRTGIVDAAADTSKRAVSDRQDFLVVKVNSPTKHAFVLNFVHRLEEFKRADIELSGHQRVVRYGSSILPLLSVSELLGYPEDQNDSGPGVVSVVVIQKAGMLFGLEVKEIIDTLTTEVETDTSLVRQKGVYGNLSTDEGLIVVVDPFELVDAAFPEAAVKPFSNPLTSSSRAISRDSEPSRNASGAARVLLVEDTPFFRRAVSLVLEKEGFKVSTAGDGRAALDVLIQNPSGFDLVISDIEMPAMNGFQLASAIRSNPELRELPLLALSSRADKRYSEQGIQAGFDLYLEKLKPAVLLEAIDRLLESRSSAA